MAMVARAQPREMDGWDSCCTLLTATCKDLACCGIHSTEYIVQNTYYMVHVHSRRMEYISSTGGVRVALAVGRSSASPWPFPGGRLPTIEPRSSEGGARRNAPPSRLARLAFLGLAFARGMAPLTGPDNRRHEKAPDGGVRVRRGRAVPRLLADSERPQLPRQAAFQTARTLGRVPGTWFSPLIGPLHAPEPVPRPCLRAGTSMEPVLACCAARTGISRGFEGPWAMGPWATADRMETIDPRAWKHLEHMTACGNLSRAVWVERKVRKGMGVGGEGQQATALGKQCLFFPMKRAVTRICLISDRDGKVAQKAADVGAVSWKDTTSLAPSCRRPQTRNTRGRTAQFRQRSYSRRDLHRYILYSRDAE